MVERKSLVDIIITAQRFIIEKKCDDLDQLYNTLQQNKKLFRLRFFINHKIKINEICVIVKSAVLMLIFFFTTQIN